MLNKNIGNIYDIRDKLETLELYMKKNQIQGSLRLFIKQYFEFVYDKIY